MDEYLSNNAFQLLVRIRNKHKISWMWAKKAYNNETNTLLQSGILKSKGRPSTAIIKPTKKGANIVKNIMSHRLAKHFCYLQHLHIYVVIACWICIILDLILLGFNRWQLVRTTPVFLVFALGLIWLCCLFFIPLDNKEFDIENKIQRANSISKLKHLTRHNGFYWNRNMDYYLIDADA